MLINVILHYYRLIYSTTSYFVLLLVSMCYYCLLYVTTSFYVLLLFNLCYYMFLCVTTVSLILVHVTMYYYCLFYVTTGSYVLLLLTLCYYRFLCTCVSASFKCCLKCQLFKKPMGLKKDLWPVDPNFFFTVSWWFQSLKLGAFENGWGASQMKVSEWSSIWRSILQYAE